jgi:hypothetical protein
MRKKFIYKTIWNDSFHYLLHVGTELRQEGWKVHKAIKVKWNWKRFTYSYRIILKKDKVHIEHDWELFMITGQGIHRAYIHHCYCGAAQVRHKEGTFPLDNWK